MAAVDVRTIGGGHTGDVQSVTDPRTGSEQFWRGQCVCGWKSPKYPYNDRDTAQTGLDAHCLNANRSNPLMAPGFATILIRSSGDPIPKRVETWPFSRT